MGSNFRVINFNLKMKSKVLLCYGEIKISLMGVMAGHFVGMDPPEWADLLVGPCRLCWHNFENTIHYSAAPASAS